MTDKLKPGESQADQQTIRDEADATERERARQARNHVYRQHDPSPPEKPSLWQRFNRWFWREDK